MDVGWDEEVEEMPRVAAGSLATIDAGAIAEAIHGDDNRRQVGDTTEFPASAIAQLIVTARNGREGGATATFITENVLLTAAHSIFIPGNGPTAGMIQKAVVVPGRAGSEKPFGAAKALDFYVPDGWKRHRLPDFDYALVFVPSLPRVGRFRPVAPPDDQLRGLSVRLAGYPLDKPVGTQWADARVIAGVSDSQVAYDVDTMEGQSGTAVAHMQDGKAFIVAIHRFGNDRANFGTRVTRTILEDISGRI